MPRVADLYINQFAGGQYTSFRGYWRGQYMTFGDAHVEWIGAGNTGSTTSSEFKAAWWPEWGGADFSFAIHTWYASYY